MISDGVGREFGIVMRGVKCTESPLMVYTQPIDIYLQGLGTESLESDTIIVCISMIGEDCSGRPCGVERHFTITWRSAQTRFGQYLLRLLKGR